jgi:hypothetical protein
MVMGACGSGGGLVETAVYLHQPNTNKSNHFPYPQARQLLSQPVALPHFSRILHGRYAPNFGRSCYNARPNICSLSDPPHPIGGQTDGNR